MKKAIGIICEFNPLHNGHIYFINEIKNKYPNDTLILVLNGNFLQRGEVSILSKLDKVKLSLDHNIDIVLEHPAFYSTQSADTFAESAINILNKLKINKLIFGSESNNVNILKEIANIQLNDKRYHEKVKELLDEGVNYPTALAKALEITNFDFTPNDLLGISYTKAIIKNNYNIEIETIKRTNSYHDTESNDFIVSASNIREKLKNHIDISNYVPSNTHNYIKNINEDLLFNILKTKILTDNNLNSYLDVDEGIENRLKKYIVNSNSLEEYISLIKTKRFTYNKIRRMLVHILLGITKEIVNDTNFTQVKVLGFNLKGQEYLNHLKSNYEFKQELNEVINNYEITSALIYDILTNQDSHSIEKQNKPIIKVNI